MYRLRKIYYDSDPTGSRCSTRLPLEITQVGGLNYRGMTYQQLAAAYAYAAAAGIAIDIVH